MILTEKDILNLLSAYKNNEKLRSIYDLLMQIMLSEEILSKIDLHTYSRAFSIGYRFALFEFATEELIGDGKTMLERAIQGTSQQKAAIAKSLKPKKETQLSISEKILFELLSKEEIKTTKPNKLIQIIYENWKSKTDLKISTNFHKIIKEIKSKI